MSNDEQLKHYLLNVACPYAVIGFVVSSMGFIKVMFPWKEIEYIDNLAYSVVRLQNIC
jgi:hypothetical protein